MTLQVSKMAKVLHVRQDPAIFEDMIGEGLFFACPAREWVFTTHLHINASGESKIAVRVSREIRWARYSDHKLIFRFLTAKERSSFTTRQFQNRL
jgi:hypothetical protein